MNSPVFSLFSEEEKDFFDNQSNALIKYIRQDCTKCGMNGFMPEEMAASATGYENPEFHCGNCSGRGRVPIEDIENKESLHKAMENLASMDHVTLDSFSMDYFAKVTGGSLPRMATGVLAIAAVATVDWQVSVDDPISKYLVAKIKEMSIATKTGSLLDDYLDVAGKEPSLKGVSPVLLHLHFFHSMVETVAAETGTSKQEISAKFLGGQR